jgi:hypothetical protein
MTAEPAEAVEIRTVLRLGWLIAEVRGRARPGGPGSDYVPDMARGHWAIPLGSERSAAEREVEAEHALAATAIRLHLDWPAPRTEDDAAGSLTAGTGAPDSAAAEGAGGDPGGAVGSPNFSAELRRLGKLVADQRRAQAPAAQASWRELARLLYRWDARIQDELVSMSDSQANAYELGRALAEMYWALDPATPDRIGDGQDARLNPVSWAFLFGEDRRADISRLLGRLTPYFSPTTPAAVAGSVEVWGKVAASEQWRSADGARLVLLEQVRNWYSLLVAGLDPETMLEPYAGLRSWRIFAKAFRAFGLEMVTGILGIAAIAGFALLLAYAPHQPFLKVLSAALGFLGVTGAGLQARLKATTQSMAARLSVDLSTDLVAEQITVTPPAPPDVRASRDRRQAIGSRAVTAPLGK